MIENFHAKMDTVNHGDCWFWTGTKIKGGYGMFRYKGRMHLAHRVAFDIYKGGFPPEVMHTCDNPSCVRPAHLKAGNHALNMADMAQKGRHRSWDMSGAANGMAKLSVEQVKQIQELRASGMKLAAIGTQFGISETHVCSISKGRRWKNVT